MKLLLPYDLLPYYQAMESQPLPLEEVVKKVFIERQVTLGVDGIPFAFIPKSVALFERTKVFEEVAAALPLKP